MRPSGARGRALSPTGSAVAPTSICACDFSRSVQVAHGQLGRRRVGWYGVLLVHRSRFLSRQIPTAAAARSPARFPLTVSHSPAAGSLMLRHRRPPIQTGAPAGVNGRSMYAAITSRQLNHIKAPACGSPQRQLSGSSLPPLSTRSRPASPGGPAAHVGLPPMCVVPPRCGPAQKLARRMMKVGCRRIAQSRRRCIASCFRAGPHDEHGALAGIERPDNQRASASRRPGARRPHPGLK
jgi:hypothetical protein